MHIKLILIVLGQRTKNISTNIQIKLPNTSKCFKVEQQAVCAVCAVCAVRAVCATAHLSFGPSESPRLTHQTALAAPKKINDVAPKSAKAKYDSSCHM